MELKEFLEKLTKAAELYDFREEIVKLKDTDDSLKRFVDYKAIGVYEEGNTNIDLAYREIEEVYNNYIDNIIIPRGEADNCDLIKEIYKELWGRTESMTGDTMNSVFTSLYRWIKFQYECSNDNSGLTPASNMDMGAEYWKISKNGILGSNRKLIGLYYNNYNQPWFENVLTENVRNFLKVSYAIGNFIPVPKGCNGPRGIGKVKDYWDLTLKAIYDYYVYDENSRKYKLYTLEEVIGKAKCKPYKDWLDSFRVDNSKQNNGKKNWNSFVEKNYMQDFVNLNADGSYGIPKELWVGHFTGEVLPEGDQCEQFFENAFHYIAARSIRMITALKTKCTPSD